MRFLFWLGACLMSMTIGEIAEALVNLPTFFTIAIGLGVMLICALLLILPCYCIFTAEIPQLAELWRQRSAKTPTASMGLRLCDCIDWFNTTVGRITSWLVIVMALMQFTVVILRYVFSWGSVQMQESIWYMHGMIFTFCVGYTLLREGHVRIDVFYRQFSARRRAIVNALGTVFFIFPVCYITFIVGLPYVANAWAVLEGSTEGTGLQYVYLIKTSILLFALLLGLQGISLLIRSWQVLQQPANFSSSD